MAHSLILNLTESKIGGNDQNMGDVLGQKLFLVSHLTFFYQNAHRSEGNVLI